MSSQSLEGSPSRRCGQRPPLRSVENEKQSPLRPKSKSIWSTEKEDVCLAPCSPPPTNVKQTQTIEIMDALGLPDVTFKSFICSSGEVVISEQPSLCPEDHINLPQDQTLDDTCGTSDTCNLHMEHPYCQPEGIDAAFVDAAPANTGATDVTLNFFARDSNEVEILDAARRLGETIPLVMDGERTDHPNYFQCEGIPGANSDVTSESFTCTGGEVEILVAKKIDETVPLSAEQMATSLPELSFLSADVQLCSDHFDHPYSQFETNGGTFEQEGALSSAFVAFPQEQAESCQFLHKNKSHTLDPIQKSQNDDVAVTLTPASEQTWTHDSVSLKVQDEFDDEKIPVVTKMLNETFPFPAELNVNNHLDPEIFPADVQHSGDHLEKNPLTETKMDNCGQVADIPEQLTGHSDFLTKNQTLTMDPIHQSQTIDIVGTLSPALDHTVTHDSVHLEARESLDDEIPVVPKMPDEAIPLSVDQSLTLDWTLTQAPENGVVSKMADKIVTLPIERITITSDSFCHTEPIVGPADLQHRGDHLDPCPDSNAPASCRMDPLIAPNMDTCRQVVSIAEEEAANIQFTTNNEVLKMDPVQKKQNVAFNVIRTPERHDDHNTLPEVQPRLELIQSNEAMDSALGSSDNAADTSSPVDKPHETMPNVLKVLSGCPSVASALRRASLSIMRARRDPADDCQKNIFSPDSTELAALCADHLESPMPRPLFNSTILCNKQWSEGPRSEDLSKKTQGSEGADGPFIPDGPLQQQLRQMAEFLILASGKMDFAAPLPPPLAAAPPPPVKSCNVCVGVTPVKRIDRSLNTSGEFERKGDFSKADACTLTDPLHLLWNCPPDSLDCVPREELEKRLMSSMIMVEALVQQLAVAQATVCVGPSAGPPPSERRNKLVQTDHTELSQTTMYRDLYLEALNRIGDLEQDGRSLQELVQSMQGMRVTMTFLTSDTVAALSDMKQMEVLVREDHQNLASHYAEMTSSHTKFKEMLMQMIQKVEEAFRQRDEVKSQMEDAQTSKEAAFNTMEQLRTRCAGEIAELQRSIGSQQELLTALNVTFPEQVALNKTNHETLNSASDLLCQTMEDQSKMTQELSVVRSLLHRTAPLLVELNEKAAAALRERDEHMSVRERAQEEREQLEEELRRARLSFQTAEEQIGDFSLQVTILTSELGVLRHKLKEREEERAQLERTITEMSATVSSTTAAHTFLEHTLAEEMSKLQQAQRDAIEAKETAEQLASSLRQSEERAADLVCQLAERDEDLGRLQALSQSQHSQIQQLRDVDAQLRSATEMNEFLQAENEVAREQLVEDDGILRALHERNIQCEDLKTELCQLQRERRSVQEELEATQAKAGTAQLKQAEELAQAVTEITLLHHTLRGVTNELHDVLGGERPEPTNSQPALKVQYRNPSSSFVDSVMVALTAEKNEEEEEETNTPVSMDMPRDSIFSKHSAFTRLPVNPKKDLVAQEIDDGEEEEVSNLLEVLAHLTNMATELVCTIKSVQRHKDAQAEELQHTVCSLQMALLDANSKHGAEASDLKRQLSRMQDQAERYRQAQQQQTQGPILQDDEGES
ncbi:sperm-associated antigen 5 isoform X2 [Vanacampus margaritifer]